MRDSSTGAWDGTGAWEGACVWKGQAQEPGVQASERGQEHGGTGV